MRLTFSIDSVTVDTIFSRVSSSTRAFWVYNKGKSGIRCQNVRLAKGNQTGFRVNVDGIYLGASEGWQTSDIEIRRGDSIRPTIWFLRLRVVLSSRCPLLLGRGMPCC